jgi:hypothetical protein
MNEGQRRRVAVAIAWASVVALFAIASFTWWRVDTSSDRADRYASLAQSADSAATLVASERREVALFLLTNGTEGSSNVVPPGVGEAVDGEVERAQLESDVIAEFNRTIGLGYDGESLRVGFDAWVAAASSAVAVIESGRTISAEEAMLPETAPGPDAVAALNGLRRAYDRAADDARDDVGDAARFAAPAGIVLAALLAGSLTVIARNRRAMPVPAAPGDRDGRLVGSRR